MDRRRCSTCAALRSRIRNAWVGGSDPFRGTNDFNCATMEIAALFSSHVRSGYASG